MARFQINISAPIFQKFREQFNGHLYLLLHNMVEDEVPSAKISCTFDITLVNHTVTDVDTGMPTEILSPLVKHKITATIQHKTEDVGQFGSLEYQMIFNKQTEQYEMVPVSQSQRSMFEDGYEYSEESEDEDDG